MCDPAAPPLWRRLASTSVLIAVAVAAHLWLVPRVDVAGDVPALPDEAVRPQLADASPRTASVDVAEAPVGTRGQVEALATVGSAPLGENSLTKDSSSIPDGTYPSEEGIAGTGGKLRPALLVRSKPERVEGLPRREAPDESTSESRATPPAGPAGASPLATPRTSPPTPVTPDLLPQTPQRDHEDTAAIDRTEESAFAESSDTARVTPSELGSLEEEEELVHLVVQEYRAAYERLDAAAAKSVWPTVDAGALRHAFNQLVEQRLNFESCGVSISGDSASARCRGEAQYLPKVGSRRALVKAGEWVFDLARQDTAWHIVSARIQ